MLDEPLCKIDTSQIEHFHIKTNHHSNPIKLIALNNQQHNHHGQHTIQALNAGQGIVNSTMSNGMMAQTIPAGSMCSLGKLKFKS